MYRKHFLSILVIVLIPASFAFAAMPIQVDIGNGAVKAGWTAMTGSNGYDGVVTVDGITFTASCYLAGDEKWRIYTGGDLGADYFDCDNGFGNPEGSIILTISNLSAGRYLFTSYHNNAEPTYRCPLDITVSGSDVTSSTTATNVIVTQNTVDDNIGSGTVEFTTVGSSDVVISFTPTCSTRPEGMMGLNGFVLDTTGPVVEFAQAVSGDSESVGSVDIDVTLSEAQSETVTVTYAVTGGTAQGGGTDYTIAAGPLTFFPGQLSRPIQLTINDDGLPEDDETIEITLTGVSGGESNLGSLNQHTYVILDPRPGVSFEEPSSSGLESVSAVFVGVTLSVPINDTVTVNYAVTGGTATYGTDYGVMAGPLVFAPYEVSKNIEITVADDTIEEVPNETIELTLTSASSNVKLGFQNQHTYTIIDNEQGVQFNGLTWFYSEDPSTLYVNPDNQLVWDVEKGSQIVTRLPEHRLSVVGDYVEFKYWWMSDGQHNCADCFSCGLYCLDDDITCIAGTSDFRAGLFEADGEYITDDGFSTSSSIFAGYKGYAWRFGPNMISGPTRWVDCTDEVHKTGNFAEKPVGSSNLLTNNEGLKDYIPGFELPPGEWSLWTIWLRRTASSTVEVGITLNDRTYIYTDGSSSGQPSKIDVFAIHMRNGRPYNTWRIEPVCKPPEGDFDGSGFLDWGDVDFFSNWWLSRCVPSNWYCDGCDLNDDSMCNFTDFALFASYFLTGCN